MSMTRLPNILLVDDNEMDVKIALRAFKQAALKNNIYVAHNGQECLDFVRRQGGFKDATQYPRPDIILLDISMPVLDGFGVLKVLKQDDAYKDIPIVILTASNNENDVKNCYALGANSYIQKPVAYEDFVKVVDSFNSYWHALLNKKKEDV